MRNDIRMGRRLRFSAKGSRATWYRKLLWVADAAAVLELMRVEIWRFCSRSEETPTGAHCALVISSLRDIEDGTREAYQLSYTNPILPLRLGWESIASGSSSRAKEAGSGSCGGRPFPPTLRQCNRCPVWNGAIDAHTG
jgi:hypothetical protein